MRGWSLIPAIRSPSCRISDKQYKQAHPPLKVKSHVSPRIHKLPLVISGTCEANTQREDNEKKCAAEERGWTFVGNGYQGTHDDYISRSGTTFTQCLDLCIEKRRLDGNVWNGMQWNKGTRFCACNKNDEGHTSDNRYLHFKMDE